MITPQQLAEDGSESGHQKALFQWIAVAGTKLHADMALAHAVPNGSKLIGAGTARGRSEGARMKAEGLRPGVPDIFLPVARFIPLPGVPTLLYHGLWIELKKPGREVERLGGRSDEQVAWQRRLLAQGYAVVTAFGWTGAADALALYFLGNLRMPDNDDCFWALGKGEAPW